MTELQPLTSIATLKAIPADRLTLTDEDYSISLLPVGLVGTIVEVYEQDVPEYLVEFSNSSGEAYALAILKGEEVIALQYELTK